MTAIAFPSSPTIGDTYSQPNGYTYTWNGTAWLGTSGGSGGGVGLSGTWHDVTASRSVGVTYTNNNSYAIGISVYSTAVGVQSIGYYVNGVLTYYFVTSYDGGSPFGNSGGFMIIPAGATYSVSLGGGLNKWFELY